jgi:serine/threonine-protein phosphatase 2B regulatory subunit
MLAPYSPKASREDKLRHVFAIWDVDGDGVVSKDDVELIVRQSGGASLSDDEVEHVALACHTAGSGGDGLTFRDFEALLEGSNMGLCVDVPAED